MTYTEEDIGLPPLPQEPHSPAPPMPDADGAGPPLPQLPDPEPPKSMEELASDFHDLLAEQGVSNFLCRCQASLNSQSLAPGSETHGTRGSVQNMQENQK